VDLIKFVIVAVIVCVFGLLCYGLGFTVGRMDKDGEDRDRSRRRNV
jgi:hypothetical protein